MKKLIIAILFFILLFSVSAQQGKVYVLGLHYENNKITITDIVEKTGFYPDRRIQPELGHRLEMLSSDGRILHSFQFDIPNRVFTDTGQEGNIEGGVIVLNETDFALVLPYMQATQEIRVSNEKRQEVASHTLENPALSPGNRFVFSSIFILILLLVFVLYYRKKD